MARKELFRESRIVSLQEMEEIINKTDVCNIAFVDVDKPYLLPLNFGYENRTIYLHTSSSGKKLEIIKNNNNVCLNFFTDFELFHRHQDVACSYGMKYKSVNISGKIFEVYDINEKKRIMNIFMKKYTGKEFSYSLPAIKHVKIFKVEASEISGKKYGY